MTARELRIAKGLSQQELAVGHDLSDRTVREFEFGRLAPTGRTRRKLAAAYGVTIEQVDRLCRGEPVEIQQFAAVN